MADDPTASDWQPLADQPITPDGPQAIPPAPPAPSPWARPEPPRPELPGEAPTSSADFSKAAGAAPATGDAARESSGWAPPAYGPPPTPPPSAPPQFGQPRYGQPQHGQLPSGAGPFAWAPPAGSPSGGYPGGYPGAAGRPPADFLESPPRRRFPIPLIVIGVVVLVVAATVGGLLAARSGSSAPAAATGPSASHSATPQPRESGGAAPPSAPAPDSPGPLDRYLLAPSDLGAGTQMPLFPDGRSIAGANGVTLDFCGYDYTSEKLRSARVQVQYMSPSQTASNEFVKYQPGGAAKAYDEITKAVKGCGPNYTDSLGTASHIKQPSGFAGLTAHHVVVSFAQSARGQGVGTYWITCVYQFDGDYFSGVYVYGLDEASVEQAAAKLAPIAARHLAEAAAGKPGTGGGPFSSNDQPDGQPGVPA